MLQWARQSGCRWNEWTSARAAGGGHLIVLQWAHQSGCSWDIGTCAAAATGGHLAVLQWARQNNCNWDEDTCTNAAEGGHLALLQWAHENNCPWSGSTTLYAAVSDRLHILKWARQQHPSCPWWSIGELEDDDIDNLISAKDSTLLWLAQQGAPLPDEAYAIACNSANWLTYAYLALRALLPAENVLHMLTLSME